MSSSVATTYRRRLERLDPKTEKVDAAVVPVCPKCGGRVFLNVREDATFVASPYAEQAERCIEWIYFGKNLSLAGSGTGATLGYVAIEPSFMEMVGSKVTNQPVPIEMDQRKRNYLHPVAGTDAARIGAGLFIKGIA